MTYRGRFAPSPSGPLHFGSLVAAVASYLQAKSNNGKWLVRIEDVDLPRSVTGADKKILTTLEALKLYWDEEVIYQSQREQRYDEIIALLKDRNYLYPCCCSRKDVGNAPYNGKCRNGMDDPQKATSIRIKVNQQEISFNDRIQGQYSQQLDTAVGDFIIKRADHMTSYNLAVVIDDADQGITEIVRGTDLIDTTPRQIYLQDILEFQQPSYMHFPIVVNEAGNKLSKQNHTPEVNSKDLNKMFFSALDFLGQSPPDELRTANLDDIIKWAINNWDIKSIPKVEKIFYEY